MNSSRGPAWPWFLIKYLHIWYHVHRHTTHQVLFKSSTFPPSKYHTWFASTSAHIMLIFLFPTTIARDHGWQRWGGWFIHYNLDARYWISGHPGRAHECVHNTVLAPSARVCAYGGNLWFWCQARARSHSGSTWMAGAANAKARQDMPPTELPPASLIAEVWHLIRTQAS